LVPYRLLSRFQRERLGQPASPCVKGGRARTRAKREQLEKRTKRPPPRAALEKLKRDLAVLCHMRDAVRVVEAATSESAEKAASQAASRLAKLGAAGWVGAAGRLVC
jgi:hypothetical protein